MKIALLRFFWPAGISVFLTLLASPPAATQFALGGTPLQPKESLCSDGFGGRISWDGDTQRCVFGGGGCDEYQ